MARFGETLLQLTETFPQAAVFGPMAEYLRAGRGFLDADSGIESGNKHGTSR
jgi:hypothetical protein